MSYDAHIRIDVDIPDLGRFYVENRLDMYSDSMDRCIKFVNKATDEIIRIMEKAQQEAGE